MTNDALLDEFSHTPVLGWEHLTPAERDYRRALEELENIDPEVLRLATMMQKRLLEISSAGRVRLRVVDMGSVEVTLPTRALGLFGIENRPCIVTLTFRCEGVDLEFE